MSSSTITVTDLSNEPHTFDIVALRISTYGDLRTALRAQNVAIDGLIFSSEGDPTLEVGAEPNESINLEHQFLQLRPSITTVTISLPGVQTQFDIESNATISFLKQQFERATAQPLPILSYQGRLLHDSDRLNELGVKSHDELCSLMKIVVVDRQLDRQTVLEVNDSWTIGKVKEEFAKKEKRTLLASAVLCAGDDAPFQDDSTIFSLDIRDDSTLILITSPFIITLKEKDDSSSSSSSSSEGVRLTVSDHYKIRRVKDEFNKVSSDGLSSFDKLIFNKEECDDHVEIYKYNITEGSILLIEREDVTAERFDYICADCGSDVKLKKTDAVRCRECGYRIVYKRRTRKPCQYLCR